MTSLNAIIVTLPEYLNQFPVNLGAVAEYVHMELPVSLNDLVDKIVSLPPSVTFHSTIVTGAALGGEATMTLHRTGSYRFSGFMNASGVPSFHFRVGAMVRSSTGQVTVAAQSSGKVFGTDTPGDRKKSWDETGTALAIRNLWPDISGGTMTVTHSSELSGVLGTATDIVKDVAEFLLVAETAGAAIAICLIIGSELGDMGVSVPGLGGVVGIGIVAGSLFIWGPLAIGPAIVAGVAVGAIIDAMVKIRRLTTDEMNFARQVFGDSIDFDRIRLTNLLGIGSRPFTIPTVDNTILINIGDGITFNSPTLAIQGKYLAPGQLFIHELTHAWQIQHSSLRDGYVPGFLCRGAKEQVFDGKAAYRYGPAGPDWRSFGVEGQASVVDEWFGANGKQAPPEGEEPIPMNLNSNYFRYINENIQPGLA